MDLERVEIFWRMIHYPQDATMADVMAFFFTSRQQNSQRYFAADITAFQDPRNTTEAAEDPTPLHVARRMANQARPDTFEYVNANFGVREMPSATMAGNDDEAQDESTPAGANGPPVAFTVDRNIRRGSMFQTSDQMVTAMRANQMQPLNPTDLDGPGAHHITEHLGGENDGDDSEEDLARPAQRRRRNTSQCINDEVCEADDDPNTVDVLDE